MLPIRFLRLAALLLVALLLASCASHRVETTPPPDEIAAFAGEVREDNFVNPDGLNIFGRFWIPTGDPRACVILLHGTTMHSGLYDELGRFLAARGYLVYGMDMQGWGRSDGIGKRGDVFNHDKYVTDVSLVLDRLRAEYPNRPVFTFGESLGGLVALLGQSQRRTFSDGLILSAPGYKPNIRFPGGVHVPEIFNNWGMSTVQWGAGFWPTWPTLSSNLGLRYIVKDPVLRRSLLDDPYVSHNWLPARYIAAIVESNKFLRDHVEVVNVPLLLLHGDKDELIPLASSQELATRTLSRDRTLKVFKGMGHAVMLQPERYEAMVTIGDWLDKRTSPR